MKEKLKKISEVCKIIFGYAIMITLFAGGLTLFAYIAALIIGGDTAAVICDITYNKIIPVIIYTSTVAVLFGLLAMYLAGEFALTASSKKKSAGSK